MATQISVGSDLSDVELVEHVLKACLGVQIALRALNDVDNDGVPMLIVEGESPDKRRLRRFRELKRLCDELWECFASQRLDDLFVRHHVSSPGTWSHKLKEFRDKVYKTDAIGIDLNERLHQLSSLLVLLRNEHPIGTVLAQPQPVESQPASDGCQEEAGTPPDDQFSNLRQFARDRLKGQERIVVEAVCDADGKIRIADLGCKQGLSWNKDDPRFKYVQRRLNLKLKANGWRLIRHDNHALLVPFLAGAKEGAKTPRLTLD